MNGFLLADSTVRRSFEWARLQSDADSIFAGLAFIALVAYVVWMYRRDAVALGRFWPVALITLRCAALAVLLVVYLQPQWRNERDLVQPSRVLMLVDTSLSMGVEDRDISPPGPRSARVIDALATGEWLRQLTAKHEVSIARFDEGLSRLTVVPRQSATPDAVVKSSEANLSETLDQNTLGKTNDWSKELLPRGGETRLSQAVVDALVDERATPLAGIVVISDGQQNGGAEPGVAEAVARELAAPIFTIGVGSNRPAVNIRVSEFVAPVRAYPNDDFTVTGFIQAQGLAGRTVLVELLSERTGSGDKAADRSPPQIEATQQITLSDTGEATPVRFDLHPKERGRMLLTLRVQAPADDLNAADNHREAAVEVVDRKTTVLLVAGAATREYQFVRNLLRRDKEVEVDVLLQTGADGISQDARAILTVFPRKPQELFNYDCIVAFDPDWRELSADQISLLDQWVSRQAGGLILIAGPVNMDSWIAAPGMEKIRSLYPVEFHRRFAVIDDARFGSRQPYPLEFTREGLDAPFLWLADTPAASSELWSKFRGVFGYYSVRGPKLDATVYARFSDPRAVSNDQQPVFLAGRYFDQVFYIGSGEMWRLRSEAEGLFETFYTKLIRHVSQGRLMRGSAHGALLVSRDRCRPGDLVELRATLNDARLEPLGAPQVDASVVGPDGAVEKVVLRRDAVRAGAYLGTFVVRREGTYRPQLIVPETNDERLSAPPIQVSIPDREREQIERNDALLAELAERTGGHYFKSLDDAIDGSTPLAARLRDASRTTTLVGTPDRLWDNWYTLGAACGLLCLEWLLRRLLKLA